MAISLLEIHQFRNLKEVRIQPQTGLNYIIGPNGSGKSSLLEAIHCLGRGKSFRTHKTNRLICDSASSFTVFGQIQQKGRQLALGMERQRGVSTIRLAGRTVTRASELTEALPVAVLEPGLHKLIEEGPEHRRKFMDWGVFHVEQGFHQIWNNYRRVLAQRNAALRAGWSKSAIGNWDRELAVAAQELDRVRRNYLSGLLAFVPNYSEKFTDLSAVEIRYQQGWREGVDYATYLTEHYLSDRERGFTQFGPHRADLRIRIAGVDARDFLSRGQQKVLVACLVLAQCEQMRAQNTSMVVLVDDLPSELDEGKRAALLSALKTTGAQVFLTSTDLSLFALKENSNSVFHVEQGKIQSR